MQFGNGQESICIMSRLWKSEQGEEALVLWTEDRAEENDRIHLRLWVRKEIPCLGSAQTCYSKVR